MKFLSRFLYAWRQAVVGSQYEWLTNDEQEWDNEVDGKNLVAFLGSDTGAKFQRDLTNFSMTTAVSACRNPANSTWHAGLAAGVSLVLEKIEELIYDPQASTRPVNSGKDGLTGPNLPVLR